ncbi:MAG: MarC family protein [Aestuariivirga sp.]|jgi:multiple antibiotic resistance protein|nr:MarC family protein [Alphaproteobacteria bacterium]
MLGDFITSAIATLLVVADPVFMSALFLGITNGMGKEQRREVALRASIIAFCILLAAGLGGAQLLNLLGISLSAFRIAGGLLLLSAAAEMVFDRRSQRLQATAEQAITVDHVRNIAAFPLAIPLMAGPGAITAMILLAGRADGRIEYLVSLYVVAGLVMAACFACFLAAERISKIMGITGRAVLTRLLGIILAALAVQFIIDGVVALSPSP